MANYEIRPAITKVPKPNPYSTWKCPFCKGTGMNPYGKSINERCPACRGATAFEAEVGASSLAACGRCAGNGRINYMGAWAVCSTCKGSGKV